MQKGKLIVIEGTDCSGKETQTNILIRKLKEEGLRIEKLGFPMYDSPTGKIVGGPYLGKSHIGNGVFEEGAANVLPKVAAAYYVADRKYNIPQILKLLDNGISVVLDRYVESNMAHQGGKLKKKQERLDMYKWLEKLEYDLYELPKPDLTILLYMPYQYALELKKNREEFPDQHETNKEHLINAEKAYLELAKLYGFKIIECIKENKIRTIEDINQEIITVIKSKFKF